MTYSPPVLQGFNLSPQQNRLWALQQKEKLYQTSFTFQLNGELRTDCLQLVLQNVVDEFEILRVKFHRPPGRKTPVMVVEEGREIVLQQLDLSFLDESVKVEKLDAFLKDLKQNNYLQFTLIQLELEKYILCGAVPSLCADYWSIKILFDEICSAYQAQLIGKEKDPSDALDYFQIADWYDGLLEDEDAAEAKLYWQQQLSSISQLKLPLGERVKTTEKFEPRCLQFEISEEIKTLANRYKTDRATLILSCWKTLLWRLLGTSEIVIGQQRDRRDLEELQDVIGAIATWVPLKTYFDAGLRFEEVVETIDGAIANAEVWQDHFTPQSMEMGNAIAFPIGFEWEEIPDSKTVGGVTFSFEQCKNWIEPFEIKLTCIESTDKLNAAFYYDPKYFSFDAVERLAEQFQTLLNSAISHPETAIAQLEILSERDREKLLVEWNKTEMEVPRDRCIHHLFEAQVEENSNRVALRFEDAQLTYTELNTRANQLAHSLQEKGVGTETIVGLYFERSLEAIIALLGILKAGGAYLPLDPAFPPEQIALRLQEAGVNLVITHSALAARLPETQTAFCLDAEDLTACPNTNPETDVRSHNLVYVLFTSGSTGKPKGVAVEHRQLVNYTFAISERLNLPDSAHFATVSTLAADLGNTAIFPSLCGGGCLHILSKRAIADPQVLDRYCQTHPIDCLKIVPSHLAALLSASPSSAILPRQCLILGGETANWSLVEAIQQRVPHCQIFNHYGPTETTIGALTYPIEAEKPPSATVPLGRPLANVRVYLLDERQQPVPIGVPGELYIGGSGVTRGYINQLSVNSQQSTVNGEQNSELSNPFLYLSPSHEEKTERLYKTGDRARYLPDGNIEFLGRTDKQVKIRGFRLELGEIESILNQHDSIQQAVVLLREDRLVAYVIPQIQSTVNSHQSSDGETLIPILRSFLAKQLPNYAIPSQFVFLKTFPRKANGKVDLKLLPIPDRLRSATVAYVAPRNAIEKSLTALWQEMLNLEKVGIRDNFFDLGGHSLLLVQLRDRVQTELDCEISITDLFEHPTIDALASHLSQGTQGTTTALDDSEKRAESRRQARQRKGRGGERETRGRGDAEIRRRGEGKTR